VEQLATCNRSGNMGVGVGGLGTEHMLILPQSVTSACQLERRAPKDLGDEDGLGKEGAPSGPINNK